MVVLLKSGVIAHVAFYTTFTSDLEGILSGS